MQSDRLLDVTCYKEKKAILAASNKIVKSPIARLDDDIVPTKKNRQGRKFKYSPTKMKNMINKYFDWCEENDEIPSIKGLMIHCKMYKDSFYRYIKNPEYEDILEHARMIISNWIETDIYNTKGMAAGKTAYAKNILGWSDKLETTNTTTTVDLTPEVARSKIEMLAPKLLELLQNHTVLNQLAHNPHTNTSNVIEAEAC